MTQEAYVSFEIAKLLKEKGFNEECFALFNPNSILIQSGIRLNNIQVGRVEGSYSAPTLQMAMKWLREVHNLYIEIFVTWRDKIPHYQWRINNLITQDTIVDTPCLENPEEAVKAAIKYCLENLI